MGLAAGGDEAMLGGGSSKGATRAVRGVGRGVSIMPLALTARGCAGSAGAGLGAGPEAGSIARALARAVCTG